MDQLRQESSENAVKKQQLEGSINVLLEQISAARQNEDHYQSRLNVIKEDLKKREGSCQEFREEQADIQDALKLIREKQKKSQARLEVILSNSQECAKAVEDGKNEIIELLNSRLHQRKGPALRYDDGAAGYPQGRDQPADLHLKSEEEEQENIRKKARAEYDAITALIQSMNEECVRLDQSVDEISKELKSRMHRWRSGRQPITERNPDCFP